MDSTVALRFDHLLTAAGIALSDVRMLRHVSHYEGLTIYELWRRDREAFEHFQRTHDSEYSANLSAPYWACFVKTPDGGELFGGIYSAKYLGPVPVGWFHALAKEPLNPNRDDLYESTLTNILQAYFGRLQIRWGNGGRYIQRADRQEKIVIRIDESAHS